MAKPTFTIDLLPNDTIVEVCKFENNTRKFIGLKVMTHGEFKNMEKQKGFFYQEYQKGYSQYKL